MTISPSVITSKAAQNDYNDIAAKHAEIVQGIADQSARVSTYNAQKSASLAAQNETNFAMAKEKDAADSEAQKNAISFAQKQADLDIRRAALTL